MSETIVEVTENGEMVGPIDRDVAHQKNIPHAIVMILLRTPKSSPQALFQVRGKNVKKYPGFITLTATGHIRYEEGRTLQELAKTNAKEELEQETKGFVLLGDIGKIDLKLTTQGFFSDGEERQYVFIFTAEIEHLPQLQSAKNEEVAQLKMLTIDEVLKLAKQGQVTPFALEALRLLKLID